jgi:hypothetical protein
MCAIRAVLALVGATGLTRPELIRASARKVGVARTTQHISDVLDTAIRRSVRRGVAVNVRGQLTLLARTIDGYDRDFLKGLLLGTVSRQWTSVDDVVTQFARHLGFARTGLKIEAVVLSLVRSCLRSGELEAAGRGELRQYRRVQKRRGE